MPLLKLSMESDVIIPPTQFMTTSRIIHTIRRNNRVADLNKLEHFIKNYNCSEVVPNV